MSFIQVTVNGFQTLLSLNAIASIRPSDKGGCRIDLLVSEGSNAKAFITKEPFVDIWAQLEKAGEILKAVE